MKAVISDELRAKIIKMLNDGKSSAEIADELNVGKMQVAGIKAHLKIKRDKEEVFTAAPEVSVGVPYPWSKTPPPDNLTPENEKTSILVGTDLIFNKKVFWDYNAKTGSVNPHVLIVGETGFGKTYAAQCIIAELRKKEVTTVIFDYGQGFGINAASKDFISLTRPSQIEASRNGIAINPLQIFPDDMMGPVNVAQRTADTFCRIYPRMGIQQKEAIIEAVEESFASVNISAENKLSWQNPLPQFNHVHGMLRGIAESDDHPLKNPAKTAYSHISSFFRFNIIRANGEKLTWDKMTESRGGTWIIQLKGLDYYVSMIITEMLLWNLISYLQSQGLSDIKMFVILDEAHKLAFDPGTPIDWLLREGRKFGVGAILSSQQLEDYSKVAIANTATKIVFQNHDDRYALSRSLAKKCKNISDYRKISDIITTLERGKAFMVNENVGRIVRIDKIEKRFGGR